MPRPTTKEGMLQAANEQYNKLWLLINSMTEEEQEAAFNFDSKLFEKEAHWKRDKNIKDVLTHLSEWHELLLSWVNANQNGIAKPFLPEQYSWKTYGDMNVEFWKKHQNTTYKRAKTLFKGSHERVMELIATFSDDELFVKKYFTWTGTTNLGGYCVSATSSHYDWAIKKMKLHIKSVRI